MIVGDYTYAACDITVHWDKSAYDKKKKGVITPELIIGKFCSIACSGVNVYLGGNHRADWLTTFPFSVIHQDVFNTFHNEKREYPSTNGDVVIGNDVWIGENVTIMSGVKIGDGAVIAAGSWVFNNVKPYSIVGGNPASLVCFRFQPEIIQRLLELKWWDLDLTIINVLVPTMCTTDYSKFMEISEKIIKERNGQ